MMVPALLLIAAAPTASSPARDRLLAWSERNLGAFRAEFEMARPGDRAIAGALQRTRPDRVAFSMKSGGSTYRLFRDARRQIELNDAIETYDDRAAAPNGLLWPSRTTDLAGEVMPTYLLSGDLPRLLPKEAKATPLPGGLVRLSHEAKGPEGELLVEADVTPGGEPRRIRAKFVSMQGESDQTWTFRRWARPDPALYAQTIPGDYSPYALADAPRLPEIGSPAAFGRWAGRDLDAAVGKGAALVAVLAPADASSRALSPVLDEWEKSGVKIVRADLADCPPTFGASGAPLLVAVKEGKVAGLWLGYDPAKKSDLATDVRSVLGG